MIVLIRLATIGRLNVYTDNHWQPYWQEVICYVMYPRVRDQLQQKPGTGIKKCATRRPMEQEDQIDQQSEVVERSGPRVACSSVHRDFLALDLHRCQLTRSSTVYNLPYNNFLFNYTQIIQFLKSHHSVKCPLLIFLYIIGYNNISWWPHDFPTYLPLQNLGIATQTSQDWRLCTQAGTHVDTWTFTHTDPQTDT